MIDCPCSGAISNTDQITGLVATQQIYSGEQITKLRFSQSAVTGIQGELKGTMRAFQVQGDGNELLAGVLREGDRVDLVATFKYQGSSVRPTPDSTDASHSATVHRPRAPPGLIHSRW